MITNLPIQPGEEIIRRPSNGTVIYGYCRAEGEMFYYAGNSEEEARKACADWLVEKESPEEVDGTIAR